MEVIKYKQTKQFIILKIKNTTGKLVSKFTINIGDKSFIIDNKIIDHLECIKVKLKVDTINDIEITDIVFPDVVKKSTSDLTKGNPAKLIISFAVPLFISSLFQQLYNSIDALIVGNFLGKEALAAVTSSGSLIHMFTSFFMGTAMGAGVLIARYFGAKDYDKMRKSIHTNVAFGLIASVILTIIGIVFTPTILKLMNTDESVLPSSIEYFRYYFLGVSAIIMYNIFNGILNAVGNSKRPLIYLIISSILNVILDLLFIGVFKLGVGSAALATTIAQVISAVLCFMHLIKKTTIYHINIKSIKIDLTMFKKILYYGLPNGIQNSVIGFANVIVQSNINMFGPTAMAASGAFSKIEGFAFLPITSFTMAISTFISQNLGANNPTRAKQGAKFGIITSMLLAELIGVIVIIFGKELIFLFNQEQEVIKIGYERCIIQGPFFCLLALSHCIAAVCRGSGRAIIPMVIMLGVWCLLRVVYISVMIKIIPDIKILFSAYPLTWFISSVIYIIYYFKSNWAHSFTKKRPA